MATKKNEQPKVEQPDAKDVLADILANSPEDADLLNSMIDSAMDEDIAAESGIGADGVAISMDFIAIPQAKSTQYSVQEDEDSPPQVQTGKIFIGNSEANHDPDSYHKSGQVRVFLVDTIMHRERGRQRIGGRLMWPMKTNGERDQGSGVGCASRNGIAPVPIYLGKELYHPDLKFKVRIGMMFNARGQEVPILDGNICGQCPFAQWGIGRDAEGQETQALCKRNTRYVVYDVAGDRLLQFSGGNLGVEHALRGRRAGQSGNTKDGRTLEGIEKPFLRNGERHIFIPRDQIDTLRMNQWTGFNMHEAELGVVGLAKSADDMENYVKLRAYDAKTGVKNDRFFTMLNNNENLGGVVLSVPTFPIAPMGKPEHTGDVNVPIYPVKIRVVENNFTRDGAPNPTLVPEFIVDTEHPMTARQYAGFLAKQREYYTKESDTNMNMRDNFLGLDDVEVAKQRIGSMSQGILVSGGTGALPAQAGPSGEAFENFEAEEDDILDE